MLANKITKTFLNTLAGLEYGQLTVELPDQSQHVFKGKHDGPKAQLTIYDEAVIVNLAMKGDIAFADDYRAGKWDSENLADLIECALLNNDALAKYIYGSKLQRALARVAYFFTQNTKKGSRKNIYAHYDLGNDFYKLWLDPTMTYSSAIFDEGTKDLSAAQHKKYDRILDRIGGTSKKILEIGCGWGGFAERGVENSDHNIHGVTISPAQFEYATQRLQDNRERANIQLEDYRNLKGKYNAIVSIEMFEAVGERYWKTYFESIKKLLDEGGKAVIQTITIDDKYFEDYRNGGDAIRSYIFPGGMLPSPERFQEEANKAGLKVTDQFFFGQDYARTLQEWLDKFDDQTEAIKAQNFDEPFRRLWRFYLASCIGSFSAKRTNVMQVELCHA